MCNTASFLLLKESYLFPIVCGDVLLEDALVLTFVFLF